jgi:hypothetical protein
MSANNSNSNSNIKNINPTGIKFKMGCSSRSKNEVGSNQKTRICKNASKPGGCPFGLSCHYAHSLDELRIMDCAYNGECVFIEYNEDGVCINKKCDGSQKLCFFRHPGETDNNYHLRIGNIQPDISFDTPVKQKTPLSPPNTPEKEEKEKSYEDLLTPIQLDLGSDSWSTVVRRTKRTKHKQDTPLKTIESNPFQVLETKPSTNPHIKGDYETVLTHIKELMKQKVKEIKFTVDYN